MASIDFYDTPDDLKRKSAITPPTPAPSGFDDLPDDIKRAVSGAGSGDLNPLAAQYGVSRDRLADYRDAVDQPRIAALRDASTKRGVRVDMGDAGLADILTAHGGNVTGALDAISAAQRGVGGTAAGRDSYAIDAPGFQFNDPYTKQLEDVARQQMGNLSQPQANPMLDRVLAFLSDRFNTLSQSPGYSPEDLAVMRTQALEPIEQDRAASRQRAIERAARGGFLPTSGITDLAAAPNGGTEPIDATYDRIRAAAQRDLAINAITKRNQDLGQAVQLGQLAGVSIPQTQRAEDQGRRQELLALSQLLYNLPRQAQQDALAVVNGTENSNSLFSQGLQTQQAALQQQQADAQRWAQIGAALAQLAF